MSGKRWVHTEANRDAQRRRSLTSPMAWTRMCVLALLMRRPDGLRLGDISDALRTDQTKVYSALRGLAALSLVERLDVGRGYGGHFAYRPTPAARMLNR